MLFAYWLLGELGIEGKLDRRSESINANSRLFQFTDESNVEDVSLCGKVSLAGIVRE
ncbi:hypothetical protein VCR14J2_240101 [Vibrio coralliirubri]|nr:hypothetical protein VCR6J2_230107 [Vibrio coralliirubri]CDT31058.1 hypothetical protein VCR1J2_400015 [Vibrio coralliirubri]CDT48787.1 hypothetical protein VCR29J2_350071 [Vibrio coralliirubri]CDT79659.1 hypothetical protein VCR12J2_1020159 [Vibrio coralliirubri]CDT84525.1 hypothetical protein VCR26J2_410015 [Vibrio coralliirubri]